MTLFPQKERLTPQDVRFGLQHVVRDGMASQAMASLTGSTFLVALAVELGASNTMIGLLAAIPHLSQLLQIPAVALVNRVQNRRLVTVAASTIGRLVWIPVAASPFLLSPTGVQGVLVTGLLFASCFAAIANSAWNSWIHDLVPRDKLGTFFGRRFSVATTTGIVISFAAGLFIDNLAPGLFASPLYGYSVLFAVGCALGLVGVAIVARIPEPRYVVDPEPALRVIARPFRDPEFKHLIRFLGAWNLAMYLATPFFTVYMLRRLEMSLAWVVALIIVGRIVNVVFLRLWGDYSDRIGNKAVLRICAPLCLLCVFLWTFTTLPERHILTLPLLVGLHAFMGVAMAGITLATGNLSLKLAPRGRGTSYLASSNFVTALSAGLAPLAAGALVDFFVGRELSWFMSFSGDGGTHVLQILNFQQWDFIFVVSAVAGLYAVHRLAFVKEPGDGGTIEPLEVLNALGRELREFSSVGSIRNIVTLTHLPEDLVRDAEGESAEARDRKPSAEAATGGD